MGCHQAKSSSSTSSSAGGRFARFSRVLPFLINLAAVHAVIVKMDGNRHTASTYREGETLPLGGRTSSAQPQAQPERNSAEPDDLKKPMLSPVVESAPTDVKVICPNERNGHGDRVRVSQTTKIGSETAPNNRTNKAHSGSTATARGAADPHWIFMLPDFNGNCVGATLLGGLGAIAGTICNGPRGGVAGAAGGVAGAAGGGCFGYMVSAGAQ